MGTYSKTFPEGTRKATLTEYHAGSRSKGWFQYARHCYYYRGHENGGAVILGEKCPTRDEADASAKKAGQAWVNAGFLPLQR